MKLGQTTGPLVLRSETADALSCHRHSQSESSDMNSTIDTIVFDVGNVLLDWDPRHLYRQLIENEAEMEAFLSEICTPQWNVEQDRGRSWKTATEMLIAAYPDRAALITAFDERWEETVAGPIQGSVDILRSLSRAGIPLYAITNFSAEKFPLVETRFDFFELFLDIVVSGEEGTIKPLPRIFEIFCERNDRRPQQCLFIDDSALNVEGARTFGMATHHFTEPALLRADLRNRGFPLA